VRALQTTFEAFAAQRMDSLLRLARLLTGTPTDAEDLVQSSLLRAHLKWPKIASADHPEAYLRKLLVNVHHSSVRKRRYSTVELTHADRPSAAPETAFGEVDELRSSILRLSVRQRTALVLRYYEDLDIDEIAEAMDLRASSVRSSIARALATLRAGTSAPQKAADEHA
jgi:RNA polymerase sigma-70 factor (sigma-E family)